MLTERRSIFQRCGWNDIKVKKEKTSTFLDSVKIWEVFWNREQLFATGNVFSLCILAEISKDFLQRDHKPELGEIAVVDCECRSNSSYSAAAFTGQALVLQQWDVAWGLQRKLVSTRMLSGASPKVGQWLDMAWTLLRMCREFKSWLI